MQNWKIFESGFSFSGNGFLGGRVGGLVCVTGEGGGLRAGVGAGGGARDAYQM